MNSVANFIEIDDMNTITVEDTVLVIMSTYNGEKYIREQMDSVLSQKNVNVRILIRDDGSTDRTPNIIKEYTKQYDNISFLEGDNVGVINSFCILAKNSLERSEEIIAFCDQDDIWLHNKLSVAVSRIRATEENNMEKPIIYCSNMQIYKSESEKIRFKRGMIYRYNIRMALVQNIGSGCTQVFNKKALNLFCEGIGKRMEMHDYWMTLIGMCFGIIIYDNASYIYYRQHENNVVGSRKRKVQKYVLNLVKKTENKRISMLQDFACTYNLDDDKKTAFGAVINYNNTLISRMKVAFSNEFCGYDFLTTIGFKLRVMCGKII